MIEPASKRRFRNACVLLLCGGLLSGCAAVVAGTAGGLIVDEGMIENDGSFDPLEDTVIGRKLY